MPVISVIVPVYQVKAYLPSCIESILTQTFPDFELILIDDGSTDGSGEICDKYAKKDQRVTVIHQDNGGLSIARNTGISVAKGEYYTLIDSDDTIHPDFLKALYQDILASGAEISVCEMQYVWENQVNRKAFHPVPEKTECIDGREAAARIVRDNSRNMIVAVCKLYHRRLSPFLHYPEGKLNEDEFVTYRVFYEAEKVSVSNRKYYYYLQHGSSIMGTSYHERRLDKLEALKEAISFFEAKQDIPLMKAAQKRYLLNLQIAWYQVNRYMKERKDLKNRLQDDHRLFYQQAISNLKGSLSLIDRACLLTFRIHPKLYSILARIYLKLFPDC